MSGAVSAHYGIIPVQAQLTRNNLSWLALTDAAFVHCVYPTHEVTHNMLCYVFFNK